MGTFYSETFYQTIGKGLQFDVGHGTIYWLLTVAIFVLIGAVILGGVGKILNKHNLQWLLLHALSIFVVSYTLKDITMNKYVELLILALSVTFLARVYRHFMFNYNIFDGTVFKWVFVNLIVLYVVQSLIEITTLSDGLLKIFFASMCLTLVGTTLHEKHHYK